MHILEQLAGFFGLHVNATKTEYICYNQDDPIETLNKNPLKKVDDLGSNIAATEKDALIRISGAWSALARLQTVWKSTLPEDIKKGF